MSRTLDLNAEQAILGSLMVWPEEFDRVADTIDARDFASSGHQAIYGAISSLTMACKPVDAVTVHSELLRRGVEGFTLAELNALAQGAGSQRGVRRYAEAIRQAALERQLLAATDQASEIAQADGDMPARLEQITALFGGMSHRSVSRLPEHVAKFAISRIDHYTALSMGEIQPGWRTGIPTLDRLLGGLKGGKVYVLAARPAVGKSSFAMHLTLKLAGSEGLQAVFLSQEMPNEELTDRAIANLGRVDYSNIQSGKLSNDEWGAVTEGIELFSKMPLHFDDEGGLTLAAIRAKARSVKGLKLLVIDYLQLCSGTGKRETNRNSELEEISRGIKTLAKELDCAVILLSQLSRDVEKRASKEPDLPDLRDSGAIEQDADAVIFLWPAREFEQEGHRLIGCKVAKNRGGPIGKFGLDFRGCYQHWGESDQDVRAPRIPEIRPRKRGFDDGGE